MSDASESPDSTDPMGAFSVPVREWLTTTFGGPTEVQAKGWPAIAAGDHTLILAPTGSGKTLTAFLWGIDQAVASPRLRDPKGRPETGTRILYISPLRALAVDVEKNLRSPLRGIQAAAARLGHDELAVAELTVGMRTGDTTQEERRSLARNPPDILITTPESLYLMLTSAVRETLADVETVIIDEIHAVAATKRGSHLALTLERLEEVATRSPQRIGLSATQRPLEEIARFLGGYSSSGEPRPVTVIDAGSRKQLEIEVIVGVDDMSDLNASSPTASIWPSIHERLLDLVLEHRSTLIFVNARRAAERLATRLNELYAERNNPAEPAWFTGGEAVGLPPTEPDLVKAHHGSLSRQQRLVIEDDLKQGRLKALVATSSLELGIDMGAVDLVIQVESPGAVSRGLQRIGRAGHQVGEASRGKLFPKHRADLLEAAAIVPRMERGLVESTRYPRNPVDVLAQQIVAAAALDDWNASDLKTLIRRAAPFHELSDLVFDEIFDLLAGRYPSEEFAELRPRIVWDRSSGAIRGRRGAQRLAVTSGGTIPDRGLYGVFLPDGKRVGELDEEMVYESRVGETFLLGASTWRIEDITHDRVVVTPAPGLPGRMPFWHGDGPGRPVELGAAMGEMVRGLRAMPREQAIETLTGEHRFDCVASANLLDYLTEQAATSVVPDDRTIVVERFRDEIGDWRVCVLSPFGTRVHAPWGMALQARLAEQWDCPVEVLWSDDGIVVRLPEAYDELPLDELLIDPGEVDAILIAALPSSAMFAARFRECAARALLLPRRRPDRRTPLWQQRQRAADLLTVAARHPRFPILYETTRELLNDVFDVAALRSLLADLQSRKVRVAAVDTASASPFAKSLLFGWIATYMYEGDSPLAERRAMALSLDADLLNELLGADELRDLLDGAVIAEVEASLQRLDGARPARESDEVHDLLRELGPLTVSEIAERSVDGAPVARWLAELGSARVIEVGLAGEARCAAAEDAARLRDAFGVALPLGLPSVFTEASPEPLIELVARHAHTHGPFTMAEVAARFGLGLAQIEGAVDRLAGDARLIKGEFRPGGRGYEFCDPEVLRRIRRRSLAALRKEIEPVEAEALARFLPAWHQVGSAATNQRRGIDGLRDVLGQLQGARLAASVLEEEILPARVPDYSASMLDSLLTTGEIVWVGAGALGARDGRIRLVFADDLDYLVPGQPPSEEGFGPIEGAIVEHLDRSGASFWPQIQAAVAAAGADYEVEAVLVGLWDLVWAGLITNDTFNPVREFAGATSGRANKRAVSSGRHAARRPGRVGGLRHQGPPSAAGRWSLVSDRRGVAPAATEVRLAQAAQMLERHGVVTREAVLAEGLDGGFAAVYPVLRTMEEKGQVRRGYFVAGLGAAQFSLPGAESRLRSERGDVDDGGEVLVLAATDPAQPFGAVLDWPVSSGRPSRSAGALVVLAAGRPLAFLEKGGRSLLLFVGAAGADVEHPTEGDDRWASALTERVERRRSRPGRDRGIEITKIDGVAVRSHPAADLLTKAGFVDTYRGLRLR